MEYLVAQTAKQESDGLAVVSKSVSVYMNKPFSTFAIFDSVSRA